MLILGSTKLVKCSGGLNDILGSNDTVHNILFFKLLDFLAIGSPETPELHLFNELPHCILVEEYGLVLLDQALLHRVLHPVDSYPPLTVLSANVLTDPV